MTPGQARRYLEESDESKVEYLRLFFNVTPSDASLYHLTVNTSKLSEDGAMDLIKSALAMIPKRDQGSNG